MFIVGSILLGTLTGCSREPSQQDLSALYQHKVDQTNQIAQRLTQQKGQIIEVKSFEKIDCHKINKTNDYSCRSKITVAMPFLGEQQNTADLHVTKTDNGWALLD